MARTYSLEQPRDILTGARSKTRTWIHLVLLLLTIITTTIFGFALVQSYPLGRTLEVEWIVEGYARFAHGNLGIWSGLYFSLPLLLILLSHEFGHYFECQHWRVDASLPYFIPFPTLFGTLGAFIRLRSPVYNRKALFDIGVSGPLAGFALLAPFLAVGIYLSKAGPVPSHGDFVFGTPLLMRVLEAIRFRGVPPERIVLHPMAMAAWGGLLATAMNLLPLGQLDGGHIVYAIFGDRWHRIISMCVAVLLALLGFLYWPWFFWAGGIHSPMTVRRYRKVVSPLVS